MREPQILVYVEDLISGLKGWIMYYPKTVVEGLRIFKDINDLKVNIIG